MISSTLVTLYSKSYQTASWYYLVTWPHVCDQGTFAGTTESALRTHVRLLASVNTHVCLEVCSLVGTIWTHQTCKWLLTSVDAHVVNKISSDCSTVRAICTLMPPLAGGGVALPSGRWPLWHQVTPSVQPHLLGMPIMLKVTLQWSTTIKINCFVLVLLL